MKDLIQMLQGMILHVHVGPLNNTTVAMMEVSKLLYTLVIGGFVTLIFSGCVSTDARAVLILGTGPILGRSCLDWQSVA